MHSPRIQKLALLWVFLLGVLSLSAGCTNQAPDSATTTVSPAAPPLKTEQSPSRSSDIAADSGSTLIALGDFDIQSSPLVSDPCYTHDPKKESGLGAKLKVKSGSWAAQVLVIKREGWGRRCVELSAFHKSQTETASLAWQQAPQIIPVDSGQAGIFDAKHYGDDSIVPKEYKWKSKDSPIDPDLRWYSLCCDQTLAEPGAGVIPFGVASSSGFGDGAYEFFTCKNKDGEITGIKVVFIDEDERR